MRPPPPDSPAAASAENPRPNPEPFAGSLIWWVEIPAHQQNYLQGVLEGYEGLGYYQTLDPCLSREAEDAPFALGRITSTEGAREELAALLEALSRECGLRLPGRAPDLRPDQQPGAWSLKEGEELG